MVLKIEIFSLQQFVKICCTIFFRDFINLWTLESKRKISGFLELSSRIVKIQTPLKTLKNFCHDEIHRGVEDWNFLFTMVHQNLHCRSTAPSFEKNELRNRVNEARASLAHDLLATNFQRTRSVLVRRSRYRRVKIKQENFASWSSDRSYIEGTLLAFYDCSKFDGRSVSFLFLASFSHDSLPLTQWLSQLNLW